MPFRPTLAAAVVTLSLTAIVCFAVPPEQSGAAAADPLIERLSSPERSARVAAEEELLRRGPDALESLPTPDAIHDPAARAAVARIRKRLENERAEQTVRPLLMTLQASGPARDVLRNMPLTPEQAAKMVDLAQVRQPYWVVMDGLARQLGGWPDDPDPTGRWLTFRDRTPADAAKQVGYADAFRIAAGPVALRPTATGDRRLIRVPVEIRAEPRLRPLFLTCAAKDQTLTGPVAKPLAPFTAEAKYELPFAGRGGAVELTLDFIAVADTAGPWTLAGKFTATVAAGEERFTFPLAGRPQQEARHGGVTVRLRDVTRAGGSADVELAVVYDRGGPAFESYRTWVYHNDATLRYAVTTNGERKVLRLDHEPGFDTLAQPDGGVVLRYRFEGVPPEAEDVAFDYVAPTKIVEAPLSFSIDGLALKDR